MAVSSQCHRCNLVDGEYKAAISHSSPPMNMGDQPALGPDGKLRDASQIEWFHDIDDPCPIQPIASLSTQGGIDFITYLGDLGRH